MANIEKLNKISSGKSSWLDKAKKRKENKEWIKHSQKIATKVLLSIREKGITQVQLSEMLEVSAQQINKIVKGKENLTLQTISKLEKALQIKLIFPDENAVKTVHVTVKEYVYIPLPIPQTTKATIKQNKSYDLNVDLKQNFVNEPLVYYGEC